MAGAVAVESRGDGGIPEIARDTAELSMPGTHAGDRGTHPARTAHALPAPLLDAMRAQWQEMESEERAFFAYCPRRLQARVRATKPE